MSVKTRRTRDPTPQPGARRPLDMQLPPAAESHSWTDRGSGYGQSDRFVRKSTIHERISWFVGRETSSSLVRAIADDSRGC
jgi:hypothetical protein